MRWYGKKIAPYPYSSLAIVQSPMAASIRRKSTPACSFVQQPVFTPAAIGVYVSHELAHAWFYGSVGDDQIREPWMDEALVTSLSMDFYRENYPKDYPAHWATWGGTPEEFKSTEELNRGIYDFDNGSAYFYLLYRQGSTFFKQVREAMGDDAYWSGLRSYYQKLSGKIAQSQDLLRALRQAAPAVDLVSIYRQYLDYPYLKLTNLSAGIIGPAPTMARPGDRSDHGHGRYPTYTVAILLDGNVITTSHQALTVTVDANALASGAHLLSAVVDDAGVNHAEAKAAFRVEQPTATPTPSPTAMPTHAATATTASNGKATATTRSAEPAPQTTAALQPVAASTPAEASSRKHGKQPVGSVGRCDRPCRRCRWCCALAAGRRRR